MTIALTLMHVPYLPDPNKVEVIFTNEIADAALTRTAFLIPTFADGTVLLAQNQRRGLEIPGGHVDEGETLEQAAIREAMEEAGCVVEDVRPIGYLRMTVYGKKPRDYAYPFPVSYQQFFTGRVVEQHPYAINDECAEPVRTNDTSKLSPSAAAFIAQAQKVSSQ